MINMKQFIDKWKGHDSYELKGRAIHRGKSLLREETLLLSEIESWEIHPEMVFDIVEIRRKDGVVLIWFDYKNDLKAILGAAFPAKNQDVSIKA